MTYCLPQEARMTYKFISAYTIGVLEIDINDAAQDGWRVISMAYGTKIIVCLGKET